MKCFPPLFWNALPALLSPLAPQMRADPLTSLLAMLTSPPRGLVSGKDEVSVPYQYLPQVRVIQKREQIQTNRIRWDLCAYADM